jgi:hypothetical protein
MKLLITGSTIENLEKMLNEYFYSSSYKIENNIVVFKNPPIENKNLTYKTKGKKHQIYENI